MAADDKALGCSALAAIAECDAYEKAAIYEYINIVSCTASCAAESAECAAESAECAAYSAQEALSCVRDYSTTIDTLTCSVQELNSDYLVRFAMLYHDVGKVKQYEAYDKAKTKEEKQIIFS